MTLSLLPQYHPWRKRLVVRPLIPLIARRATRIITVSEHARGLTDVVEGEGEEQLLRIVDADGKEFGQLRVVPVGARDRLGERCRVRRRPRHEPVTHGVLE